ncbi:uncharacterized protein EDB93DRAFT_1167305 [Suillus bovinus]|uniref:uncharacterized protein n=1 Tax=Suillus bovinus TaxID=48563 RepID=UPI001B86AD6A|nr:uncharacterized protein EDB93DRAFT_1167305 [Suillus bovinus]KAG2137395.1 hypothetical protein EDB93DRAFT_1167305 [Suillus bovinus]
MSDPRDRAPPLPRIVKSARKLTEPRLDNTRRPSTSIAAKTVTNSSRTDGRIATQAPAHRLATDQRLDNPTRLVAAKTATNNARPGDRLAAKVPALRPATTDTRIDAHNTRDQELNARPVSRNSSRPVINNPLQQNDVAVRGPKKVTFSIEDFPLPVERRPVARNRVGQNLGRSTPGHGSSGTSERREELPSQSVSFFPERSSRVGAPRKSSTDVPRRDLGRQSTINAFDQHRATKSQQMRLHIHTESFSGKYARKFEGIGGRTNSRVPRMSSTNRGGNQGHLVDSSSEHSSGSANYVDVGLKLSKTSRGKSSGKSVEIVKKASAQVKAARKFQFGLKSTRVAPEIRRSVTPVNSQSSESSDNDESPIPAPAREDSEELEYVDLSPQDVARKRRGSSSESDVAEKDEAAAEIPSDALIEALENISLTTIRLVQLRRLPFMLRHLRKGFLSRCKSLGIDPSHSIPPSKPVTVVYKCVAQIAEDRYPKRHQTRTTMTDWRCPLCGLHGIFPSQTILNAHLQWDHSGVDCCWDMDNYTLWVELPLTRHVALPAALPASRHVPLLPHPRAMTTTSTRTTSTEITDFSSNFHNDESTPATTQPPSRNTSINLTVKPKWHNPILRTSSLALSTSTRSSSVSSRTLSRAPSSHASGRPTPPPRSDPLGPAAQYPYLLESDGIHSCRVGGPRLYDLLSTLPLDEFGVLAWVILDREEEIFEMDNVRDEDKVMQALWFRWIFLNRNKFVADFFKGTETFINDNWKMIDRAAGVAALRTWLLVLSINNFLMTSDVVVLLRHYRRLTGKRHWYDDNHATQTEVAPV